MRQLVPLKALTLLYDILRRIRDKVAAVVPFCPVMSVAWPSTNVTAEDEDWKRRRTGRKYSSERHPLPDPPLGHLGYPGR